MAKKKIVSASIQFAWKARSAFRAEGDKLRAEGDKLRAEGGKLRAEGDKLWAEAILEVFGNIKLEWKYNKAKNDYDCHLENGNIFVAVKP